MLVKVPSRFARIGRFLFKDRIDMGLIIRGLSNDAYHHAEEYRDYVSSSQLKHYLKSPKAFRYAMLHPDEEASNENLEFGSLFHSAMEAWMRGIQDEWLSSLAVFDPPLNEKTGQPYGATTKAYSEAYGKFLTENSGKTIATAAVRDKVCDMVTSLFEKCGETSEQVKKLAKWSRELETSYFFETEEGTKLKVRPDLLTGTKLIDWKTCSCILDEESIVRQIVKYRYDVSLAMYQWVLHQMTGTWYQPYLVFVSKVEPCEAVMVDMSLWCYNHYGDEDIVIPCIGALEFQRLLDLHTECIKKEEWPGVECLLKESEGVKVMKPEPPVWFGKRLFGIE